MFAGCRRHSLADIMRDVGGLELELAVGFSGVVGGKGTSGRWIVSEGTHFSRSLGGTVFRYRGPHANWSNVTK